MEPRRVVGQVNGLIPDDRNMLQPMNAYECWAEARWIGLDRGDSFEILRLFRNLLLTFDVSYHRSGPCDPGTPSLSSRWRRVGGHLVSHGLD